MRQLLGPLLAAACIFAGSASGAAELKQPGAAIILTVSGKISASNGHDEERGAVADFDLTMLQALPQTEIATTTTWTEGEQRFQGVLMRDLLELVGADGSQVRAIALNDYEAVLPTSDFETIPVLLALTQNDRTLRVRDRGPIWIIYPRYGSTPELDNGQNYKMVWQLRELIVE